MGLHALPLLPYYPLQRFRLRSLRLLVPTDGHDDGTTGRGLGLVESGGGGWRRARRREGRVLERTAQVVLVLVLCESRQPKTGKGGSQS